MLDLDDETRHAVIEMSGCPLCLADFGQPCRQHGPADRNDVFRAEHPHQLRINRVFTAEEQTEIRRETRWRYDVG